jgi:hypothetical protein
MRTPISSVTPSGEPRENICRAIKQTDLVRIEALRLFSPTRAILVIAAFLLGTISSAPADSYGDLARQGYRWVVADGPYACAAEQDVQSIVGHHTDEAELHMVESIRCYYLTPGTIAQLIKEDPAKGMTEIRLRGVNRFLWTYTKFLSKRPVRDTYGVIETPENSGFIQNVSTLVIPAFPDRMTSEIRQNGNP